MRITKKKTSSLVLDAVRIGLNCDCDIEVWLPVVSLDA